MQKNPNMKAILLLILVMTQAVYGRKTEVFGRTVGFNKGYFSDFYEGFDRTPRNTSLAEIIQK